MKEPQLTHLEQFHKLFGIEGKKTKGKIEYRVPNLDDARELANVIIERKKFNLKVSVEGNMANQRSFYVKQI